MTPQPTLFDLPGGEQERDHGVGLAEKAGRVQTWRHRAYAALDGLAEKSVPFTADDLIALVGLPGEGMNRNNAVGAVINGAARRGLIVKTGAYRKSRRRLGHARAVAEWVGNPDRFPIGEDPMEIPEHRLTPEQIEKRLAELDGPTIYEQMVEEYGPPPEPGPDPWLKPGSELWEDEP